MALRTTAERVRDSIAVASSLDLTPFMVRANALTSALASADTNSLMNAALLLEVETMLACYYASLKDPIYQEKTTGDASAKFAMKEGNPFWQAAVELDLTGFLASLGHRRTIKFGWLGKPVSEQTAYEDRD